MLIYILLHFFFRVHFGKYQKSLRNKLKWQHAPPTVVAVDEIDAPHASSNIWLVDLLLIKIWSIFCSSKDGGENGGRTCKPVWTMFRLHAEPVCCGRPEKCVNRICRCMTSTRVRICELAVHTMREQLWFYRCISIINFKCKSTVEFVSFSSVDVADKWWRCLSFHSFELDFFRTTIRQIQLQNFFHIARNGKSESEWEREH